MPVGQVGIELHVLFLITFSDLAVLQTIIEEAGGVGQRLGATPVDTKSYPMGSPTVLDNPEPSKPFSTKLLYMSLASVNAIYERWAVVGLSQSQQYVSIAIGYMTAPAPARLLLYQPIKNEFRMRRK